MHGPIRAYVDTSVFGGTEDDEFRDTSVAFFELVRRGKFSVFVSTLTLDELAQAPPAVRRAYAELPEGSTVEVSADVEDEAGELARAYVAAGVLGPARSDDALHVAIASVARADLVLSWNFKHIVNYDRIRGFNGVNALNGYPPIEVRSPLEVVYGEGNADEDL